MINIIEIPKANVANVSVAVAMSEAVLKSKITDELAREILSRVDDLTEQMDKGKDITLTSDEGFIVFRVAKEGTGI